MKVMNWELYVTEIALNHGGHTLPSCHFKRKQYNQALKTCLAKYKSGTMTKQIDFNGLACRPADREMLVREGTKCRVLMLGNEFADVHDRQQITVEEYFDDVINHSNNDLPDDKKEEVRRFCQSKVQERIRRLQQATSTNQQRSDSRSPPSNQVDASSGTRSEAPANQVNAPEAAKATNAARSESTANQENAQNTARPEATSHQIDATTVTPHVTKERATEHEVSDDATVTPQVSKKPATGHQVTDYTPAAVTTPTKQNMAKRILNMDHEDLEPKTKRTKLVEKSTTDVTDTTATNNSSAENSTTDVAETSPSASEDSGEDLSWNDNELSEDEDYELHDANQHSQDSFHTAREYDTQEEQANKPFEPNDYEDEQAELALTAIFKPVPVNHDDQENAKQTAVNHNDQEDAKLPAVAKKSAIPIVDTFSDQDHILNNDDMRAAIQNIVNRSTKTNPDLDELQQYLGPILETAIGNLFKK